MRADENSQDVLTIYLQMHTKADYVRAILQGIGLSTLTAVIVLIAYRIFVFETLTTLGIVMPVLFCVALGAVMEFVRLRREDALVRKGINDATPEELYETLAYHEEDIDDGVFSLIEESLSKRASAGSEDASVVYAFMAEWGSERAIKVFNKTLAGQFLLKNSAGEAYFSMIEKSLMRLAKEEGLEEVFDPARSEIMAAWFEERTDR